MEITELTWRPLDGLDDVCELYSDMLYYPSTVAVLADGSMYELWVDDDEQCFMLARLDHGQREHIATHNLIRATLLLRDGHVLWQ